MRGKSPTTSGSAQLQTTTAILQRRNYGIISLTLRRRKRKKSHQPKGQRFPTQELMMLFPLFGMNPVFRESCALFHIGKKIAESILRFFRQLVKHAAVHRALLIPSASSLQQEMSLASDVRVFSQPMHKTKSFFLRIQYSFSMTTNFLARSWRQIELSFIGLFQTDIACLIASLSQLFFPSFTVLAHSVQKTLNTFLLNSCFHKKSYK